MAINIDFKREKLHTKKKEKKEKIQQTMMEWNDATFLLRNIFAEV